MNSLKLKEERLAISQILQLDDDFSLIQRLLRRMNRRFRTLVQRHKGKIRNIIYLHLIPVMRG